MHRSQMPRERPRCGKACAACHGDKDRGGGGVPKYVPAATVWKHVLLTRDPDAADWERCPGLADDDASPVVSPLHPRSAKREDRSGYATSEAHRSHAQCCGDDCADPKGRRAHVVRRFYLVGPVLAEPVLH